MTERHRFILQACHPEYACPAFETMFTVQRLEELQVLLGPDAQDDPQLDQKIYHLDAADIEAIRQRFNLAFEAGEREVVLRVKTLSSSIWCRTRRSGGHVLRADQIKDVNGLLLERIDVVAVTPPG